MAAPFCPGDPPIDLVRTPPATRGQQRRGPVLHRDLFKILKSDIGIDVQLNERETLKSIWRDGMRYHWTISR
jgi:hypothetical protein